MKSNINADNVLEIITIAEVHSIDDLKEATMEFIVKNAKTIKIVEL